MILLRGIHRKLDQILGLLRTLSAKETHDMSQLDDQIATLQADVTAENTVIDSSPARSVAP